MKDMNNENILHFIGASYDHQMAFVLVWSHTARRSLEKLLFDDEMQLNMMFKASIIRDLVKVSSLLLSNNYRAFPIIIVSIGPSPFFHLLSRVYIL